MAAIPNQITEFGFGSGLAQKEDPWLSSSGLGTLHNCVQDKTGAITKLPGYSQYSSLLRNGDSVAGQPLMDNARAESNMGRSPKLIKRGEQIAAISAGMLFAKTDKWTLQGRVAPYMLEQSTLCQADGSRFDCCCSGDWAYSAFETSTSDIRVVATYIPTGEAVTVFARGNLISLSTEPRIVPIDNAGTALLFYLRGTQGKYHVVTPNGITAAQNITLASGYDAVSDPAGARVWFSFLPNASTVQSDNYNYSAGSLTLHATMTQTVNAGSVCSICVDVSSNRLVLAWVEYLSAGGGNFSLAARGLCRSLDYSTTNWAARSVWEEPTPAPIGAGHSIYNIGVAFSPFDGFFFAFTTDPFNGSQVIGHWISASGVPEGAATLGGIGNVNAPLMIMRTRPAWDVQGQRMFFLAEGSGSSRGYMVLGIEPRTTAGKLNPLPLRFGILAAFAYLTASSITLGGTNFFRISRPFQDGNGVWHVQGFELGGQGATLQLLRDYSLVADDRVGTFTELGSSTYINGGVLSIWDGVRVAEAGFHFDPSFFLTSGTSPGGSIAPGNYTYAVTYSRMTCAGELIRSRPSLTATVGVAVANTIMTFRATASGPTNLVNQDANNVSTQIYAEFWRSEVNTASPLYFAGRVAIDPSTSTGASFTDAAASYAGAGVEQLYSDGTNGEIANTPPPCPLSICEWRNRLWATDGDQIFYTKEGVNTRAAEWSQAFFAISRGAPDRLTALAPLGEVLMAFAGDSTSYVYGDGPGADGSGSTLAGPMPVSSELGCTQAAGIAQLPSGLLVPTRRGLHTLNLKREYEYAGAAIEDTLAQFPRVRQARLIGGTNRVWLCLAKSDLTDGIAVNFDTHHGTWSTAFSSADNIGGLQVQCSTIDAGGVHLWSEQSGSVFVQSASYLLDTNRYQQQIETPWFKGAGPGGEIRARRFLLLAKMLGGSGIHVEIAYDFSSTYKYSMFISAADLNLMEGAPDTLQPRMPFPRQRCQSFRLRFTEGAPAGSSAGFRFISLRLAVAARPASTKPLSVANSFGAFTKS